MTPETLITPYRPQHRPRIVTAAALYDGHDAAISIMRRMMQSTGAEVIHLGHNRSVEDIARAALQEDAQGVAVTSYQGGHMEFFSYLRKRLNELGLEHVKIYGGGGGTITPDEIKKLHDSGTNRIFSPDDGRKMGLQGMINMVVEGCDTDLTNVEAATENSIGRFSRSITRIENGKEALSDEEDDREQKDAPVVGITGTGGAGKSSLTDELVRRFLLDSDDKRVAVLSADPSRRKTGGALLGDRIRLNSLGNDRVYMRSLATREYGEVPESMGRIIEIARRKFDLVIVETAGIGQGDSAIADLVDTSLYVMTGEYGAPSQLEKIDMLDFADFVAINKFTRRGSEDALRDVRKQYQRNHALFETPVEEMPVFGTSAAHFNDGGVNALYAHLIARLNRESGFDLESRYEVNSTRVTDTAAAIVPPERERHLSEAASSVREYRDWAREQSKIAAEIEGIRIAFRALSIEIPESWESLDIECESGSLQRLVEKHNLLLAKLAPECVQMLNTWDEWQESYAGETFRYQVRDREITIPASSKTLSGLRIPKVMTPRVQSAGDRLLWRLMENVPGEFPYTAGTFPLKRQFEDPTRMFAGERLPEHTNARFHKLSEGQDAARLSTAFDSITLYGENPAERPDIYGKIGESGVSIFSVEEAEQLYAGFDLCDPKTSVSMTINGPAPTVLAFFFNAAVRQQCRRFLRQERRLEITEEQELQPDRSRGSTWEEVRALMSDEEYAQIRDKALKQVRGTVQADILKEDQGQNTCIFSTEFSLRMMGDVQQYFTDNGVRNFYSVSISGYHIAEAGANPIHQLAFTLANALTYVEYYLSRGMNINEFAPNLSFFFSNGMDPEYSVIGRVARRIWSVVLDRFYGANARSQMLKYHIQTSGRSLHAQEMQFNDIRTTLQALLATFDNAQSLHTNAYDEAVTTPTEESVRRAMAIQLIINREFGLARCENAMQGSLIIEELTDLVEKAVLQEFDRLSERGGVLGAMELQYQRGEIQGDSIKYEQLKHSGELPVVGVNTFLPKDPEAAQTPRDTELTRATAVEKNEAIRRLKAFHAAHADEAPTALERLRQTALDNDGNTFEALMEAAEHCSLGQITAALYEVGGEYRRNM